MNNRLPAIWWPKTWLFDSFSSSPLAGQSARALLLAEPLLAQQLAGERTGPRLVCWTWSRPAMEKLGFLFTAGLFQWAKPLVLAGCLGNYMSFCESHLAKPTIDNLWWSFHCHLWWSEDILILFDAPSWTPAWQATLPHNLKKADHGSWVDPFGKISYMRVSMGVPQ